CSPSTTAVTRRLRVCRWHAIAPAMSIRCMTVPPRMNPSGLASFGRTTCTISVKESSGRLEVVSNPESKLHLPEDIVARRNAARPDRYPGGGCIRCEERVLPRLIEERLPRKVEVHRKAQEEALEAEAVRCAAVDQPQPADLQRLPQHGREV